MADTVQPTVHGRIAALDVLRGAAILGILLANIGVFATPYLGVLSGQYLPVTDSAAASLNALVVALVVGKFRSTLSILFGVGIWLQYRKRSQVQDSWPGGYMKRAFYLAVFGLIHGLLIWWGDILFSYALIAFAACLMVEVDTKKMWWAIGGAAALFGFGGLGAFGLAFLLDGDVRSSMSGGTTDPAMLEQVYAHGTYLDMLAHRASFFIEQLPGLLIYTACGLPLFMLGILFGRAGVLAAPSKRPRLRNGALAVGLGVGLPLNLLALVIPNFHERNFMPLAWELFFGPVLAVGYVMLGAIAVEQGWLKPLQMMIANVGRMALSCYILQSLICTFLFYNIGLGLYGQLDASSLLGVVAAVWLVNIVLAAAWLKVFAMGPLEWLWRSLTESKMLPILRSRVPQPELQPAHAQEYVEKAPPLFPWARSASPALPDEVKRS